MNENPCNEGFVFNLEKAMCLPDKKKFSVNSASIQADNRFSQGDTVIFEIGDLDCDDDSIYVPEVGLCLPVNPEIPTTTPSQSADEFAATISSASPENCPEGTIFNPEVGICLDVPTKSEVSEEFPQAMALVSDSKPSSSSASKPPKLNTWSEPIKCEKGTVYVSEIDLCLPFPERPQGDQPAKLIENTRPPPTTTEDTFRLTLAPLTSDQIGSKKCRNGQVYISEVDLCIDL